MEDIFEKNLYIEKYINTYKAFIFKTAISVVKKCPTLDVDDIVQQMLLVLVSNGGTYTEDKNVSIDTFFSKIILNAAISITKKYWQIKNRANVEALPLDAFLKDCDQLGSHQCYGQKNYLEYLKDDVGSFTNPEVSMLHRDFEVKLKKELSNFSPDEKKVYRYYMEGFSVQYIANKLGVSKKTIYNLINRIKFKLRRLI